VDVHKNSTLNYDKNLVKIKDILKNWSTRRNLTPIGKITVIKTLLVSQLNHLFIALPNPSNIFISKLTNIHYSCLWNGKNDRIKRDIIVTDYEEGELKMVDLNYLIDAIKSTWIRCLFICNSKCTKIFEKEINTHLLFNCGIDYIQICVNKLKNSFWKGVLIAFNTIQEKNKQNSFAYFLNRKFFNFL